MTPYLPEKYKKVACILQCLFCRKISFAVLSKREMDVSYTIFRGSSEGQVVVDETQSNLGHDEVFIETTHSGLYGADEHYLKSGQVLGHEGIGIIKALGPGVSSVKIGDRVGFGYTHKICANCDKCAEGSNTNILCNIRYYRRLRHDSSRPGSILPKSETVWSP